MWESTLEPLLIKGDIDGRLERLAVLSTLPQR